LAPPIEGSYEEFARTNKHAEEIGRISEGLEAGVPEEEIINYRRKDPGTDHS
jgi:hypothetical protein